MHQILLATGLLALGTIAEATDYWVKNGGSNAAAGTSPATAWATLPYAATQVGPGDTVHVLDGSYQGFHLTTSGTPGNPITFVADGPNVQITSDNPTTPDGINLEGASHVVVDGFVVTGRTRAGIRAVLAEFVTIRNNTCGDNGVWGIFSGFVDDLLIEDNETYGSIDEHGIYVSNSGDRPIVRRNLVHDNSASGIQLNADASLGGDGIISDALIERFVIWENGELGGAAINLDGVQDSVIRNNLLYHNRATGIVLYFFDGAAGSTGNVVVNNTVINDTAIDPDVRWCIDIQNDSTGNTVLNNILYNNHGFRGAITIDASSRPGFVSSFNSVVDRFSIDGGNTNMSLAQWQAEGYGASSFLATPSDHFVSPGSDFHLISSSPAVDAGTATNAPPVDLDGNPRPVGDGFDIGAYELQVLNTFVVDTTATGADCVFGDGVCATCGGDCTFRAAVQEANNLPGLDRIVFDIPGTQRPYEIFLGATGASGVRIDDPVEIDGTALMACKGAIGARIVSGATPTLRIQADTKICGIEIR